MDTQLRERELYKSQDSITYKEKCNRFKCNHLNSISWSAVFTGALIGIGISFIFNLFAMATGLTAFATTSADVKTIAIGGFVGLLLIAIFSMGTAGWVSGYLGRPRSLHRDLGVIYGFAAWCVALVLAVILSTSFGKFITYNVAALQNPTYVLTNVDSTNAMNAPNSGVTNNPNVTATSTTSQNPVDTQHAAKALGLSTFLVFVLAFIGGIASCIGGHWGFRSSERDILYYRDSDPGI